MISIPAVSRRMQSGWIARQSPGRQRLAGPSRSLTDLVDEGGRRVVPSRAKRHRADSDAGFTLIELMVVLLILAILLAIAIPTFLGVTKSANDRAAQSNLNTALLNAKTIFQGNNQGYALTTVGAAYVTSNGTLMATSLYGAVPNLTFTTGTVTGAAAPAAVSVAVVDNNGIALAEQAKGTNNCWFVFDNSGTEAWTSTGTGLQPNAIGTWYGESKNASTCTAGTIPAPNGPLSLGGDRGSHWEAIAAVEAVRSVPGPLLS
jgi:type IV pilus assembly protein PilA